MQQQQQQQQQQQALFAPIGPTKLLRLLKEQDEELLGRFHLVLAHDIVEHSGEWKDLLPEGSLVIIDNSIIELGKPVESEVMVQAVKILGDSIHPVVVLPDKFDDPYTTYTQSALYYSILTKVLPSSTEYMYVLQSSNPNELKKDSIFRGLQLAYCLGEQKVCWWGIPRRIADNMGTRMHAVLEARQIQLSHPELGIKVHLLGFSNNIQDDIYCCQERGIIGIDSTVPLRLGQRGINIDLNASQDQAGLRSLDNYWDTPHTAVNITTSHNLRVFRRALSCREFLSDYEPQLRWPPL